MNKFIENVCDSIFSNGDMEEFKNKTILITGANGLIGGLLSEYFNYLNVTYESLDLSMKTQGDSILDHKIDYCFYCAGYAQPSKFMSDFYSTLSINLVGLHDTLESIFIQNKHAKVLYLRDLILNHHVSHYVMVLEYLWMIQE